MAIWIKVPLRQESDGCCAPPIEKETPRYEEVHIPVPDRVLAQLAIGDEVELVLKGTVGELRAKDTWGSGKVMLKLEAIQLPKIKDAMEAFASDLVDED